MSVESCQYSVVETTGQLEELIQQVKAVQKEFAQYSQEQVDKIFLEAAMAANKARIPLAKLAVEETGMGIVEDKVIKNHYASEYIYNKYSDIKTCGIVEEDKEAGTMKIAAPLGVLAAVIPTTNPTSTAIFKCLIALNQKRHCHQPPPQSEKKHHRSGESRTGSGGKSRRAARHHPLD